MYMAKLVYTLGNIRKLRYCTSVADDLISEINRIHGELARAGRIPTQVVVAGQAMEPAPDLVAAYVAQHPGQDLTITIESAPIRQVVQETARSAIDYLGKLQQRVPDLAHRLYGDPSSAGDSLPHLLEGLAWITDFLQAGFPILNENLQHQEQALLLVRRWRQATDCLAPAISSQDFTMLADVLLDEILPILDDIRQATTAAMGAGANHG